MEIKAPWKSKVIWFNILAAVIIAANSIGFAQFSIDPDVQALVVVVINIVLRFLTTQKVSLQ